MREKLDPENRASIVNYRLEHGATFSLLFEKRQSSDYSDFAYCDLELVNTLRPRAAAFVAVIEKLTREEE